MTAERKFTPTKWKVKADYNVENYNGDFVATTGCNGRDPEIGKANARLIASAPDLYEACKAVVKFNEMHESEVTHSQWVDICGMLNQAIAKAEATDEKE